MKGFTRDGIDYHPLLNTMSLIKDSILIFYEFDKTCGDKFVTGLLTDGYGNVIANIIDLDGATFIAKSMNKSLECV